MEKIQLKRTTTNLNGKSYSAGEIFINTEKKEIYAGQKDNEEYITLKQYNTGLYDNNNTPKDVIVDITATSVPGTNVATLNITKMNNDGQVQAPEPLTISMSGTVERATTADKLSSNAGTDGGSGVMRLMYFKGGKPEDMEGNVGDTNNPVYIKGGKIHIAKTVPSITFNGLPLTSTRYSIGFYAPTQSGTSEQILTGNGAGNAPMWKDAINIIGVKVPEGTKDKQILTWNYLTKKPEWKDSTGESLWSGDISTEGKTITPADNFKQGSYIVSFTTPENTDIKTSVLYVANMSGKNFVGSTCRGYSVLINKNSSGTVKMFIMDYNNVSKVATGHINSVYKIG